MKSVERSQQYESILNEDLLKMFLENREDGLKRELVLRYAYLVKTIAAQMRGLYISSGELEDAVSEGIIALMGALDRFDPTKNVKFSSYASLRIRGAIIDYARKQDWVPRSVRKTAREMDAVSAELYAELGRSPTDEETAQRMGMTLEKYHRALTDCGLHNLLSLDELIEEVQTEDDPTVGLQKQELHQALKSAVEKLSEREQLVVSLYYRKELNMKEIARILDVSEPRISQILSGALRRLRKELEQYVYGDPA